MRTERGTDRHDEAFRKFANAPKKEWHKNKFTVSSCTHTVRVSVCLSAQNCRHMLNEATDFTEARIKCHAHSGHTTDTHVSVIQGYS